MFGILTALTELFDIDYCDNGKGGLYCTKDGRTFTVKEFSRK